MADIELKYNKIRGKGVIRSNFLEDIRNHFSVPNERYEINNKNGIRSFERFHIINKGGEFDSGLFLTILKYVKENFDGFSVSVDPELKKNCIPKLDVDIVDLGLEDRYYQKDAIEASIKYGRGITKVGTGGGKTYMMATLLESLYKKNDGMSAIIFVPTLVLVNQTYDDFKDYNCTFKFCKWTGTEDYDESANVYIVLVQNYLAKAEPKITKFEKAIYGKIKKFDNKQIREFYQNMKKGDEVYKLMDSFFKKTKKPVWDEKLKRDMPHKFIKENETHKCLINIKKKLDNNVKYSNFIGNMMMFCDYVIVDECHGINNTSKITNHVRKFVTRHKFGYTGTLPKPKMDYWTTIGIFGPVTYEKKTDSLREEGYLTNAVIQILKLHHLDMPDYERYAESKNNWSRELEFCSKSPFRNETIKKVVSNTTKNSLIVVERIEQGETLQKILSTIPDKKVYFIQGTMEDEERERIKKEMEENDNIVCIAISKIFSVGVSINNIHFIFFISMGKSFIKVIQTIGRGLRKHHSKVRVVIFDICDDLIYSLRHLNKRLEYYEEENFNFTIKEIKEKL